MAVLVTGGSGFIGSNFILDWMMDPEVQNESIINIDKLTYAGNPHNLSALADRKNYYFVKGDIGDSDLVRSILAEHKPRAIINFAAESHVDRSIRGPESFIQTNVVGTFNLIEATRIYWNQLGQFEKENFRFIHVSTDEVYGSLSASDPPFCEENQYQPNSPYSASKAASDHIARAWHHTYGLPIITTNCSNNYGPYQFPEKLIPLTIVNALSGKSLPIYGDGLQVRDWLYVGDHCSAIRIILKKGSLGETYNIGGWNEQANISLVRQICGLLNTLCPKSDGKGYESQITHVQDRLGHDRRYAMNACKLQREMGWKPRETIHSGLHKTVRWYLGNPDWIAQVQNGAYRDWMTAQYSGNK